MLLVLYSNAEDDEDTKTLFIKKITQQNIIITKQWVQLNSGTLL